MITTVNLVINYHLRRYSNWKLFIFDEYVTTNELNENDINHGNHHTNHVFDNLTISFRHNLLNHNNVYQLHYQQLRSQDSCKSNQKQQTDFRQIFKIIDYYTRDNMVYFVLTITHLIHDA